jgi:hypothetical protein
MSAAVEAAHEEAALALARLAYIEVMYHQATTIAASLSCNMI